jgi:hypothetical protein
LPVTVNLAAAAGKTTRVFIFVGFQCTFSAVLTTHSASGCVAGEYNRLLFSITRSAPPTAYSLHPPRVLSRRSCQ